MTDEALHDSEQLKARIEHLEKEIERLSTTSDQTSLIQMLLRDNAKRREAEEKLALAQEWIQLAQEVGCAAAYTFDFATETLTWSASTYALYGWPANKAASLENWLSAVHPEDRKSVEAVASSALSQGKPVKQEYRIIRSDGEMRWIQDRGQVLVNEKGQALRLVGLNVDITESKLAEERLNFVVGEVAHRFKNLLTVFQAMVQQSARDPNIDGRTLRDNLLGRIEALARSKQTLLKHDLQVVPLSDLVEDQLHFVTGRKRDAVTFGGAQIVLSPSAAQAMGMALHELATNACKHGALVGNDGTVTISWRNEKGQLLFEWRERWPDRQVKPSNRKGFGSQITKTYIERALKAKTQTSLEATGFHWSMTAPIDQVCIPDRLT